MFSEGQKRRAGLSVLEKLRGKGMPSRPEESMESMFEVAVNDGEGDKEKKKKLPDIEVEDDTAQPPQPSLASPASKKKKTYERGDGPTKKPAENQEGAKGFMKSFGGVK